MLSFGAVSVQGHDGDTCDLCPSPSLPLLLSLPLPTPSPPLLLFLSLYLPVPFPPPPLPSCCPSPSIYLSPSLLLSLPLPLPSPLLPPQDQPAKYKSMVPTFVNLLQSAIGRRLPKEMEYHGVPAPWVQIRLLKILAILGADDPRWAGGLIRANYSNTHG